MMRIFIVGVTRNCENFIDKEINRLNSVFLNFGEVYFYIVESDSIDATNYKLGSLKNSINNFDYISLGSLASQLPKRTERIAYCRNKYLDFLKTKKINDEDYVVVADLDGINELLDVSSVQSCFSRTGWDAVFANQDGPYYDIWALRHNEWCSGDCWEEYHFLVANGVKNNIAYISAVASKQIKISISSKWLSVDSAFGGLGIYRASEIIRLRYVGLNTSGAEICEHVSLNKSLVSNGGRIFINPGFINARFTEHTNKHIDFFRQYHINNNY